MSTEPRYESRPDDEGVSGWAAGGVVFAATVMIIIGFFQVIAGLVAIIDTSSTSFTQNYTFDFDTSLWGGSTCSTASWW